MTLERIGESESDEKFRYAVKEDIDSAKKEIIVITGELGSYAFPELKHAIQHALSRGVRTKFYANENVPIDYITDIRENGGEVFIGTFRARDHYLVVDKSTFIVSEKEGLEIPTKIGTRRLIHSSDQPEDAKKIVRFFDDLIDLIKTKRTSIMRTHPKEPNINEVVSALENPKYDWRTIDGIANDTRLSTERILHTINTLDEEIIRSPIPDEKGHYLYTTRKRYKTRGLINRFLTIASGRIRV